MTSPALGTRGFTSAARDSARSFRCILESLSRPGLIVDYMIDIDAPTPLTPALAGILLTLADPDTMLWLDESFRNAVAEQWLRFHTGARIAERPDGATFAIGKPEALVLHESLFAYGTAEYPDRSTTLIAAVDGFDRGPLVILDGPGNAKPVRFRASADVALWRLLQVNARLFPLGLDCILVSPTAIAAVPRSTTVTFPGVV